MRSGVRTIEKVGEEVSVWVGEEASVWVTLKSVSSTKRAKITCDSSNSRRFLLSEKAGNCIGKTSFTNEFQGCCN